MVQYGTVQYSTSVLDGGSCGGDGGGMKVSAMGNEWTSRLLWFYSWSLDESGVIIGGSVNGIDIMSFRNYCLTREAVVNSFIAGRDLKYHHVKSHHPFRLVLSYFATPQAMTRTL